jgi:ABC-type Fe3+-siderophore transport system, permease component
MSIGLKKMALMTGIAFMIISVPLLSVLDTEAAAPDDMLLIDMGNGQTTWYDITTQTGESISDVLKRVSESNGHTYSESTGTITLDEKTSTEVGGAATTPVGTFTESGRTGFTITSFWTAYEWSVTGGWVEVSSLASAYTGGHLALGFYPSGVVPIETPEYRTAWTMIRGDAEQTGAQEATRTSEELIALLPEWTHTNGNQSGVLAAITYAQDHVFVKYSKGKTTSPAVECYDLSDGGLIWRFDYPGINNYETATPVIAGDYIYIQSGLGYIFKFSWKAGPGPANMNVTTFNGVAFDIDDINDRVGAIPYETDAPLTGMTYSTGAGSLVFDSGAIYCLASNGMVYCLDMDLNLIWSYQMGGHTYYLSPTVYDDYVFAGALNGSLYVIDKKTGVCHDNKTIYTHTSSGGGLSGSVGATSVFENNNNLILMFSFSDGRGMSSTVGGIGICSFDTSTKKLGTPKITTGVFGLTPNYLLPIDTPEFTGVYFAPTKGLYKMDTAGTYTLLNNKIYSTKAPITLLNGKTIILTNYEPGKPLYEMGLDGKIISLWTPKTTIRQYGMSPALFIGNLILVGNDAGMFGGTGAFPAYVPPVAEEGLSTLEMLGIFLFIIILIIAVIYVAMRLKGIEKPFNYLSGKAKDYVGSEALMHNTRSKHRLFIVMLAGLSLTAGIFIACLCIGPTVTMSVPEMFSSLFSSISKGGQGLTYNELMVYESRLPRTLAAIGVGIGLAIAGCMYQAIIRNPLVDPYIMGVSAGAGTAAVAVIALDFTFFGLFSPHSIYLTAFAAIVGGVMAFFATMLIAEKAGGNSLNYVLAGVVVGLAFSAVQTLMLSFAGHEVSNALSWLFGSFANVSWHEVGLILIPALALSLVPLVWAKEFNLVLLGEDQAQQMGLNVRKFNRIMLIMASILTSICVAFVGIIGFVGLVIPHVCRMMLGGDHRLVLPASIAFGGALMMFADLAARMLYLGQELPVGAITTIIGVPVFAYLLIKRGKLYEG